MKEIDLKIFKRYKLVRRIFWLLVISSILGMYFRIQEDILLTLIGLSFFFCICSLFLRCPYCKKLALSQHWFGYVFFGNPFGGFCINCASPLIFVKTKKQSTKEEA